MSDAGFIVAGYAVTASVLGAYLLSIRLRVRRVADPEPSRRREH